MLNIISAVMKWGWMQLFLCALVSGTLSPTVHQPTLVSTAVGHDVIMPCYISLSRDDKARRPSILYWQYVTPNNSNYLKVWPLPQQKYHGRVDLMDDDENSLNKSIVLRNVQWADGWKYLCKITINSSVRRRGNQTLLVVHDVMTFNLSRHNDSLLVCEVNVTRHPRLALSIFHDGHKLGAVGVAMGDAGPACPYVTLSQTVSVRRTEGKYECQLHLNRHLITESIFLHPLVDEVDGDAARNVSQQDPKSDPDPGVEATPEPWFLYTALLLVHITILLGLVTALLVYRR